MFSTSALSSVRARFIAAVTTIFALVALGGVTAAPASADANIYIYVIDNSTGLAFNTGPTVGDDTIGLHRIGGGDYSYLGDASNGSGMTNLPDGDYYVTVPGGQHTQSNVFHLDATSTSVVAYVDRFKVGGSVPAAAGAMAVELEQYIAGGWYVATYGNISAGDGGAFQFRAPNVPADYRLHFHPAAGTDYLETVSSTFTIDGSVDVLNLGAVALNLAPSISGTVYTADGVTPILGATVTLVDSLVDVASATTDAAGHYIIRPGVGDANYYVRAEAPHYVDQEWDQSTPGSENVPVNATDGYVHTGIDFALDAELVVIGGTISNAGLIGAQATAQLYAGGTVTPTLLDETTVPYTGVYSFAPVPSGGTYFIRFTVAGSIGYLDTLLGAGGTKAWSRDAAAVSAFSVASSFTVDSAVPSSLIHNVTLVQGATLRGYYTSAGARIDGCVYVTDVLVPTDPICVVPNSIGYWEIRVPAGQSYTLYATDGVGEYVDEWWQQKDDEPSADVLGPVTPGQYFDYNFTPMQSPAKLYGFVNDVASSDPIIVHLYRYAFGEWLEADEKVSSAGEVLFWENVNHDTVVGLVQGDYRMRFEDSAGNWLAATSFSTGLLPDAGTPGTAPACFIDFSNVHMGRASFIEASFDSSLPPSCGPQPLNYGNVSGHLLPSPAFSTDDVAGHGVTLTNVADENDVHFTTTDADGRFTFELVANGTYTLAAGPIHHVFGEHEFGAESTVVLTGGNVVLPDIYTVRYGNAYGTISNWHEPTMGGAVATVYSKVTDGSGDHWLPGPIDVEISSTGEFDVPGINVTGSHAVLVRFPESSGLSPVFLGGGFPHPTSPFTELAEQDHNLNSIAVDTVDLVTITGTAFFGAQPLLAGVVLAYPVDADDGVPFFSLVDSDGTYSIEVAPNVDYWVAAVDVIFSPQILMQFYGGGNYPVDFGCPCAFDFDGSYTYDAVEVGSTNVTGINFALIATDEVLFDIEPYATPLSDYEWLDDVDMHLYKQVSGSWVEVDTENSDSWRELVASGDGDYRVRFSLNGEWLAIQDVEYESYYPYADDVDGEATLSPARCYYELSDVARGSYVYAGFGLDENVECTETVATTPTTVKKPKPGVAVFDTTVTPEPTPTPTPTASPSDDGDGGSDEVVDDKPATTSSSDWSWLFWVCGVLALLILAGGAVYFVRRRR